MPDDLVGAVGKESVADELQVGNLFLALVWTLSASVLVAQACPAVGAGEGLGGHGLLVGERCCRGRNLAERGFVEYGFGFGNIYQRESGEQVGGSASALCP